MAINFELPNKGQAQIRRTAVGLELTIPSTKSWLSIIGVSVWLVAWSYFGFIFIASVLGYDLGTSWRNNRPPQAEVGSFLFLTIWLFGLLAVLYQLLWSIFGFELITVGTLSLSHEWSIMGFGRKKHYDVLKIERLRTAAPRAQRKQGMGTVASTELSGISFDYGIGTVLLAKNLEVGEAQSVLDQILYQYPNLRTKLA
jgi:hypothetical protein